MYPNMEYLWLPMVSFLGSNHAFGLLLGFYDKLLGKALQGVSSDLPIGSKTTVKDTIVTNILVPYGCFCEPPKLCRAHLARKVEFWPRLGSSVGSALSYYGRFKKAGI